MFHWLVHFLGADTNEGHFYNFWSGFGADLGELAIIGAAIGVYRRHNCHVNKCWRIAKQDVLGTSWRVCHKHHPLGKPTEADIAAHHTQLIATREAQATVLHAQAQRARDRSEDPKADPVPVEIVDVGSPMGDVVPTRVPQADQPEQDDVHPTDT